MLHYNKDIQGTRDTDNYKTPSDFYDKLDAEFGFDFDPCPYKCTKFDGLKIKWKKSVFVNPPYSKILPWIKKALDEIRSGNSDVVVFLLPVRSDTAYWHDIIFKHASEVRLVRGRLNFSNGRDKNPSPFPVCLIIFKSGLAGNPDLVSYEN